MLVFDIDGTLFLVGKRLKYLNQKKKDWDAFYNACGEDKPNAPIIKLYHSLSREYKIIFITGRRESTRAITWDWLKKHHLVERSSALIMRQDNDYRSDTLVKIELAAPFIDQI